MHMFVSKFNEFVMHRNLQEGRERHWTKMVSENVGYSLLINLHTSIYEDVFFLLVFFLFCCSQVSRKLRVGVPIEEHAQSLYTRAMYV